MPNTNRRLWYGVQAIGFAPIGSTTYTAIHGIQSGGVNTNFTREQVNEMGQSSLYDNVEILPEIEVTLEKAIDGYAPLWCQATVGATSASLPGRFNAQTSVAYNQYGDTQNSASGTPVSAMLMSGMYPANPTFTLSVDGISRESLTLQGNEKLTVDSNYTFLPTFTNTDVPFALTSGSGGVQRRRNMVFDPILNSGTALGALERGTTLDANGTLVAFRTLLPQDIPGITASGTNPLQSDGSRSAHVQDITVTCNLSRENIYEQGKMAPYFKYPVVPVEVTTEIAVIGSVGDNVSVSAEGLLANGRNTTNRTIKIRMEEGLWIDLGMKNALSSVGYTGGGTDGSNVTITYTYQNYNDFVVTHPQDPSGFAWPY